MLRIIGNVGGALMLYCAWSVTAPSALAADSTQRYGFCAVSSQDWKKVYVATFATPWPVVVSSIESRFSSFVVSKYDRSIRLDVVQCNILSTSADAQRFRSTTLPPTPGVQYIETGWAPETTTQPSAMPTPTPPSAPSPSANASPAATAAKPVKTPPQSGKYPTQAAAQADFDSWVTGARASSSSDINGVPEPIITNWKY